MKRLHTYFERQQAALRAAGVARCPRWRVTPGMARELAAEAGEPVDSVMTCQGRHEVEIIKCPTRAVGHNVILAPREDLFVENEDGAAGFQLVSLENSVTAIPDNIACVEVISVGEMAQNVAVGELVFVDFFDVKQGYILASEELYIAGCEAFKACYDSARQRIVPLANFVTTRAAPERFQVAVTGTDRLSVPPSLLTSGIAGGRTSQGDRATSVLYQEVVAVGPLLERALPGLMTRTEASLLDALADYPECLAHGDDAAHALLGAFLRERAVGRRPDIAPGDLVVFCRDVAQQLRVRGEYQYLMPYSAVLAVIDDGELLDSAIRRGAAGRLQLVG